MMDQISSAEQVASGEQILFLVIKIGVLIFLFLYVIFAAIVIKQVRMMTETLEVGFESQIKLIVYLHLVVSIMVLIVSFFILWAKQKSTTALAVEIHSKLKKRYSIF